MKIVKSMRDVTAWLLLCAAKGIIQFLPRRAVMAFAKFLGLLSYVFSPMRRHFAEANLELVYGDDLSRSEKRSINIKSFQSFALVLLDLYWFNYRTDKRLAKYFRYDSSFERIFDGTPNVIVTAHFGNWEIVSLALGRRGIPLVSVALTNKNPLAEKIIKELRVKSGSQIVPRDGALRHIIRAIRKGSSSAFLLDHNTLPDEGGEFVPFFGLAVPVSAAVGAICQRVDAKVVVAHCFPDRAGCYTVYAAPPFRIGEDEVPRENSTAFITAGIEDFIRAHPQYWLWCYRRWRFFRADDPAQRYPFYAESYEEYENYCRLIQRYRRATAAEKEKAGEELSAAAAMRRRKLKQRRREFLHAES